tara:strand:- start:197 stop:1504 length:1308 start_codon:yes stop_codon:yes gene_type:complete
MAQNDYESPKKIKSRIKDVFANLNDRVNILPDGSEQQITSSNNVQPTTSQQDPTGSIPGNIPSNINDIDGTVTNKGGGIKPMNNRKPTNVGSSFEQDFGKNPIDQFRQAKKERKAMKSNAREAFNEKKDNIRRSRQDGPEKLTINKPGGVKSNIPTFSFTKEKGISQKQANLETKKARKQYRKEKSPMNYLDPNTTGVQGNADGMQDPMQTPAQPNRAGRPVNSNVLINDPNNYQDPSKVPASQSQNEQMFSNIASSMGQPNPPSDPMNPNMDTMGGAEKSPFNNMHVDPPKKQKSGEKYRPAKSAYPLSQSISFDKKDTVSYEMRPGKTTMENIGTKADGTPNMVPSTTYSKNRISNKDYANRMGDRVDRAKTPLKKNWIKGAIKKPGQLRKDLGVAEGEKIPKSKLNAAADGEYGKKTQQRANLAKTLSKFKK